jgi:hypothetical protein
MPRRRKKQPEASEQWWTYPPRPDRESSRWTRAEQRGFVCVPTMVGVGPNERKVSDEQWVEAVLTGVMIDVGPYAFWVGFTNLLRAAFREFYNENDWPAIGNYDSYEPYFGELPLPNAAIVPGDCGYVAGKWTPEMMRGMKHNPVFVGIPPFPQLIAQDAWCQNIADDDQDDGVLQRFANVLFCLRRSYGCAASPEVQAPLGYMLRNGLFMPMPEPS